jgi:hypothetical protein
MYKPLKLKQYLKWIGQVNWSLTKGKIDWLLLDENGNFICTIKIQHPETKDVVAHSVKKTEERMRERGLI